MRSNTKGLKDWVSRVRGIFMFYSVQQGRYFEKTSSAVQLHLGFGLLQGGGEVFRDCPVGKQEGGRDGLADRRTQKQDEERVSG